MTLYRRRFAFDEASLHRRGFDKRGSVEGCRGFTADGIVLNAGAYTHTSVGIGDAIKAIATPVVEVHISNTFSREDFRHTSYITPNAKGLILGFGLDVYRLAIESFIAK